MRHTETDAKRLSLEIQIEYKAIAEFMNTLKRGYSNKANSSLLVPYMSKKKIMDFKFVISLNSTVNNTI